MRRKQISKFIVVAVGFAVSAGFANAQNRIETETFHGREVAAHEVLVRFKVASDADHGKITRQKERDSEDISLREIMNAHGIYERRGVGGVQVYLLHSRSETVQELIDGISARSDIEYVEPDGLVRPAVDPNDTYYSSYQWNLHNTGQSILNFPSDVFVTGKPGADINAYSAWNLTTGSSAVVVAVVDEGIDYNHPDLSSNVWSAPSSFTATIGGTAYICPAGSHGFTSHAGAHTCDPIDQGTGDYHGTFVSGVIGAIGNNSLGIAGVNWSTSILASAFLLNGTYVQISDAVDAIEFVIQAKLNAGANVRVLNASWLDNDPTNSGYSQSLVDEINRANSNEILIAAAAGNGGENNDQFPTYPASYGVPPPYCNPNGEPSTCFAPNVISVAMSDNTDNLNFDSGWGAHSVELAAPGTSISSIIPTVSNNGYCVPSLNGSGGYCDNGTGTSAAAPHVTGAAALILSRCADLTTAQLKSVLLDLNNLDQIPPLVEGGVSRTTITGGRLNAYKAVVACGYPVNASASPSAGGTISTSIAGTLNGNTGTLTQSCGSNCNLVFKSTTYGGQTVSFTATQASTYYFKNWSGAGTCSGASCSLSSTGNTTGFSITANFALNTLTVSKTGSGTVTSNVGGINCGATCSANFNVGTVVTLTAAPGAGYYFSNWSGACSGSSTCMVTMNQATSVTANFALNTLTVNFNAIGLGAVNGSGTFGSNAVYFTCTASNCQNNLDGNTSVTLIPAAYGGNAFTGWSNGSCTGIGSCSFPLNGPQSVTANFAVATISVTAPASGALWQFSSTQTSQTITWNSTNLPGTVRIDLLRGGQFSSNIATGVSVTAGTYTWTPSTVPPLSTDYQIQISSELDPVAGATGAFEIQNLAATAAIALTSANTGVVGRGGTYAVTWIISGTVSSTVKLDLYKEGVLLQNITPGTSTSAGTYSWSVPAGQQIASGYSVKITDTGNSATSDQSHNFLIVR